MALLSTNQRQTVESTLMQDLSKAREVCSALKADLLAAVNAADQWVEDNSASFNAALPVAARTTLTAAQKARLLAAVVLKRFGG